MLHEQVPPRADGVPASGSAAGQALLRPVEGMEVEVVVMVLVMAAGRPTVVARRLPAAAVAQDGV